MLALSQFFVALNCYLEKRRHRQSGLGSESLSLVKRGQRQSGLTRDPIEVLHLFLSVLARISFDLHVLSTRTSIFWTFDVHEYGKD